MNDLKIDLNFLKNYSSSLTHNGYNILTNNRLSFANEVIAFSHTDILMGTSFKDGGQLYADLVANARILSRTHAGVLGADGFTEGYGLGNSYILIPAFKAAIGGKNLSKENPTKSKFPLPNWQIIYSGLKNIPLLNRHFSKIDVLHGYKATYTVAGIQSSSDYYNYEVSKNTPMPSPARLRVVPAFTCSTPKVRPVPPPNSSPKPKTTPTPSAVYNPAATATSTTRFWT